MSTSVVSVGPRVARSAVSVGAKAVSRDRTMLRRLAPPQGGLWPVGRRLGRFVILGSMDDADVLHVSSARRVVLASSVRLTRFIRINHESKY